MAERSKNFAVAPSHPIFAGHFPGRPIVPGVMLLEWAQAEISHALGRAPHELRVREVKFFAPLAPEQCARLRFDPPPADETRCAFDIRRDDTVVARGTLEWNPHDGA